MKQKSYLLIRLISSESFFSSPGRSPGRAIVLPLALALAAASALAKSLTLKFFMWWARRCQASYPVPVTGLVFFGGVVRHSFSGWGSLNHTFRPIWIIHSAHLSCGRFGAWKASCFTLIYQIYHSFWKSQLLAWTEHGHFALLRKNLNSIFLLKNN